MSGDDTPQAQGHTGIAEMHLPLITCESPCFSCGEYVKSDKLPDTVKEHYNAMETNASMCIECGSCEKNCPFGVKIIEQMKKANKVFSIQNKFS